MDRRKRVGILISGRGSNMTSLIDAAKAPDYPAEIGLVISNKKDAPGLALAAAEGIATKVIRHRDYGSREIFDAAITAAMEEASIDLICNAGFMRLHSAGFVSHWRGRQLNIHPSLLPSFRGLHPQRQALQAGVRLTGCTVHFVTEDMDEGPIVAQAAVPVFDGDTEDSLSARILTMEHALYPLALKAVASETVIFDDCRASSRGDVIRHLIYGY